ncbi:hypothetical protein Rumeso_00695 [Rubellimicrobium mesophilum DSM 19309]|uniref:Uncharacterized protein n=1 Tax=Rubellimicrobium mesophilum DSM 19309 TaxID=442562 RepID=A0A017HTA0_9RHOB|nr:hypothetical protein Rumeso_00695 [Rubellimicrobium mesophilum DSM 19309]
MGAAPCRKAECFQLTVFLEQHEFHARRDWLGFLGQYLRWSAKSASQE